MKKNKDTFIIYNGAIDIYYPLKFETKLRFGDLYDTIAKSVKNFLENYRKQAYCDFSEEIDMVINELGFEELKVKNTKIDRIQENDETKTRGAVTDISVDISDNNPKIKILTNLNEYFFQMENEGKIEYNHSTKIYGELFACSQGRIVLPPIEIKYKNGTTALLEAVLIIYKNKTAILRITMPLENVDNKPLISNDIDEYIETAKTFYGYPIELRGATIDMIVDSYFRFLVSNKKIKSIIRYKCFTNIMIANYSEIFDDVKHIPSKDKEELYKILIAPVEEFKGASYVKEAEKHIDENTFYFKGGAYITSSMGRCVSIVDRLIVKFAKEHFEEGKVFDQIIKDLRISAEFSIMILSLRLVNDGYTCDRMVEKNSKLIKVKNDYNRDKVFISLLHSDVYGSVRELTEAFENNMTYFIDQKNVEERMASLNEIVEGEYRNRTEQLQNKLSIMGLIFTVIFGLPAINETLTLIRKACCCIQGDIPCLTIDNCSFVLWLLITIVLSLFVFLKSKIKKFE